jgi:hypothetical protein
MRGISVCVTSALSSVWGTSSSDVYTVGIDGTILYYNGTAWSSIATGTATELSGVWGTSSGDVYVVGEYAIILRGTR